MPAMQTDHQGEALIGVVVVMFNSAREIGACVRSLLASEGAALRIILIDNASSDDGAAVAEQAAAGTGFAAFPADAIDQLALADIAPVTLIRSPHNLGFAGGCNLGLSLLKRHTAFDLFWVLNPDCEVMPDTAAAFRRAAALPGAFGLMGGRIRYWDPPHRLQSDGARVRALTGVAVNVNNGCQPGDVAMPDPASIDYICGASMVASRAFIDTVGLMEDDYFLYYEEVDWAARRGNLPFRLCADAIVLHHAGATIGSGNLTRAPNAFSQYFNYRNRLRFMMRFRPLAAPITWAWAMGQIAKLALRDGIEPAMAAFLGLNQLPPPAAIRQRLSPAAAALAFGRKSG